ncbi:MAG: hypothetical protein U9Q94_05575 [Candidatus Bipolaricaulota bacterium]|nr:hypothetical protein [Candidatus Bipolaricaulota bacterium]
MAAEAKVSQTMKKKEIIEEYNRLLDEFKQEVAARKEAESRLSELDKRKDAEALDAGLQATVDSALEGTNRLRALIGTTLNDLGDKLTQQAEKLEQLTRAVRLQEARLKDLHDIEYAADTMAKLADSYAQEKDQLEKEYASRSASLEEDYTQRTEELERSHAERKAELERKIENARAQWKEEEEDKKVVREREQAEYEYNRDRTRRLEEDEYAEQRAVLERELRSMREEAEKEIAARKEEIERREEEFARMSVEIEEFPQRIETAAQNARAQAIAELKKEMENKAALAEVEHEWEKKALEQTIAHLRELDSSLEKKILSLSKDLSDARKQLNVIAEKAVEGTSISKAFESVNQFTHGQGRSPEKASKE